MWSASLSLNEEVVQTTEIVFLKKKRVQSQDEGKTRRLARVVPPPSYSYCDPCFCAAQV